MSSYLRHVRLRHGIFFFTFAKRCNRIPTLVITRFVLPLVKEMLAVYFVVLLEVTGQIFGCLSSIKT